MQKLIIYWSRRDFRLHDNPALTYAITSSKKNGVPILPLFILEDYMVKANPTFQFGYPSRVFLSRALPLFAKNFDSFCILRGKGARTLLELSKRFELEIHVNEDVYPDFYTQVEKIKRHNITIFVHDDMMTVDRNLRSGTGNIYSVFTPFKKALWKDFISSEVLPKANLSGVTYLSEKDLSKIPHQVSQDEKTLWELFSHTRDIIVGQHTFSIDELLGKPDEYFFPYKNEDECLHHFKQYLHHDLENYKEDRDSLEKDKTSRMSLGLAWGLISARTIKQEIVEYFDNDYSDIDWFFISEKDAGQVTYLSELIWREFYKYLLYHYPNLMTEEFQEKFRDKKIMWVTDDMALERFKLWIQGKTGYSIVDAAMMQLAKTGWMHNRARMVVASVLTKNLGVDWRLGQEYFRAMLVDLDESSNNGGWQWGASVGADPKPIRIFNPYLQAKNYDPDGVYQKKWLGDERYFFAISPLVEHKNARKDALKRYGLSGKEDEDLLG
jgi:deoxyribodipyrimidine photo-lyase